jgi:RNA polymerase sigma-70 factor (ECF subfamily)
MTRPVRAQGDDGQTEADAALVRRVRRGDTTAFESLFRAYATPLRAFACRVVHEHDVARELVQDVFLSIWIKRRTWVVQGSVSTYLFRAIRNRALNAVRLTLPTAAGSLTDPNANYKGCLSKGA